MSDGGSQQYVVGAQFRVGRLFTTGVLALIVLHVAGFIVPVSQMGMADWVVETFGFSLSSALGSLCLWQFVTHTMIYPTMCTAWSLVGALMFLLFVGSRIEKEWGTARFLTFYAVMAACTGLFRYIMAVGSGAFIIGSLGVVCGLLGAYAVLFRGEQSWVFFAMTRAEYIAWGLVVVLGLVNLRPLETFLGVSGAAFGYAYARIAVRRESRRAPRRAPKNDRFSEIDLRD